MARSTQRSWLFLMTAILGAGLIEEARAGTLVTVQYQQTTAGGANVSGSFTYDQSLPADAGKPGVFDFILNGVSSPDKHNMTYTVQVPSPDTESCADKTCNKEYQIKTTVGVSSFKIDVAWTAAERNYECVLTFTTLVQMTKSLPTSNAFWQAATVFSQGTFVNIVDGVSSSPIPISVAFAFDTKPIGPVLYCPPPRVCCRPVYAQPRRGCCLTRLFARHPFRLCRR